MWCLKQNILYFMNEFRLRPYTIWYYFFLGYLKGCQETTTLKWKQGWGLKSSEYATPYNCKTKVASIDSIFLTINHGCYFYGIIWDKVGKLVEVVVIREKGDAPLNLTMVVVHTSPHKFNR
ncbi:uncharacterized protein LOC114268854 isoform X2 [Camellia sinensis]|nr:uncharacterized protein LOC114268854 isoform X2 [Camellia sinensis]